MRSLAFALSLGIAATSAAYFLTTTIDVPLAWYDPVALRWSLGHRPSSVAIDWYGRTFASLAFGAIVFALTRAVAEKRTLASSTLRLGLAWAAGAFVLAGAFYAYALWGRRAAPEALPSWYQLR